MDVILVESVLHVGVCLRGLELSKASEAAHLQGKLTEVNGGNGAAGAEDGARRTTVAEIGETGIDDHANVTTLLGDKEERGVGLALEMTPGHADAQQGAVEVVALAAVVPKHWVPIWSGNVRGQLIIGSLDR